MYTWVVGKILFFASILVPTMSFFGHPLNFFVWDDVYTFIFDQNKAMTSHEAAWLMIIFWMILPYIVPFAWANNFYLWFMQIQVEIVFGVLLNVHLQLHLDINCFFENEA